MQTGGHCARALVVQRLEIKVAAKHLEGSATCMRSICCCELQFRTCGNSKHALTTSKLPVFSRFCRGCCSNGLILAERLLSLLGDGVCSNCLGFRLSKRDTRLSSGLAFSSRVKLESVDEDRESWSSLLCFLSELRLKALTIVCIVCMVCRSCRTKL